MATMGITVFWDVTPHTLVYPEDRGSKFLWFNDIWLPNYTI